MPNWTYLILGLVTLASSASTGCCWKNYCCSEKWGCEPVVFYENHYCKDPCDSCGNFTGNGCGDSGCDTGVCGTGGCGGALGGCSDCASYGGGAGGFGLNGSQSAFQWAASGRPVNSGHSGPEYAFAGSPGASSGFTATGRPVGPATQVAGMNVPPNFSQGTFAPPASLASNSTRSAIRVPAQIAGNSRSSGAATASSAAVDQEIPEYLIDSGMGRLTQPAADPSDSANVRMAVSNKAPRLRY